MKQTISASNERPALRSAKSRIEWIDIAKGIAIILVVAGHIFDSYLNRGMYKSETTIIYFMRTTIYSFHMPLFFMLSGVVYALGKRISKPNNLGRFCAKKAINLLIPYFTFSYVFGLVYILVSNKVYHPITIESLLMIPIHPILQYWFIYALFFIFIFTALMDYFIRNDLIVFLILIAAKIVSIIFQIPTEILSFVAGYGVYFYFGKILSLLIKNYRSKLVKFMLLSIPVFIVILTAKLKIDTHVPEIIESIIDIILAFLGSVSVIAICMAIKNYKNRLVKLINYFGMNCLQIYLIHRAFSYIVTLLLVKQNIIVNFIASLFVGIAVPIIVCIFCERFPIFNFFFRPYDILFKRGKKAEV